VLYLTGSTTGPLKALFGGAFPSFCVCGKLQKQEAAPNGVASPTNEKLQKFILHCKPRS